MSHIEHFTVGKQIVKKTEDEQYMTVFLQFAQTVAPLEIHEEHLAGKVMVIGQAMAFPERALVCSWESRFKNLRKEIHLLVCCDPELFTHPNHHFETPIDTNKIDIRNVKTPIAAYTEGAGYALREYFPRNFLDTIMAFEIPDLSQQLDEGLINEIARVLKPGGFFMGSGSLHTDLYYDNLANDASSSFRVVQQVNLRNPSHLGYPFYNHHRGVILQKK